jgi:ATP-dependent protease ClpP protease subunit
MLKCNNNEVDSDDDIKELIENDSGNFFKAKRGYVYSFYLSGEIQSPEKYLTWFNMIRNSGPEDEIIIHINSHGGNVSSVLQFIRVLSECRANTIASVEGFCHSAATFFLFVTNEQQISDLSSFLFHTYSNFHQGKGGELDAAISFEKKWSIQLLNTLYKGFLTKSEIFDVLNNRDIWMGSKEVVNRLNKMKKRRSLQNKPLT